MHKILTLFSAISILFLSACSSAPQTEFSREGEFIRLNEKLNIYDTDFAELEEQIEDITLPKDNKIAFWDDNAAADIYFTPSGDIMKFDMKLRVLADETDHNLFINEYWIGNNSVTETDKFQTIPDVFTEDISTMTGLDVQLHEKEGMYSKDLDFDFSDFSSFISQINDLDLKDITDKYVPEEPVRYELTVGKRLWQEVVDSEDINCIFLDCSTDEVKEIGKGEIPESTSDLVYFPYSGDDYWIIFPYYQTYEYAYPITTPDHTYSANNIIVIFH